MIGARRERPVVWCAGILAGFAGMLLSASAQAAWQNSRPEALSAEPWRVRLLSPLTAHFNRSGDIVSARVLDPAAYRGAILEGIVRDSKAGGGTGRMSSVLFEFLTLHVKGESVPVGVTLLGAANSRGEPGVDEDRAAIGFAPRRIVSRPAPVRFTVRGADFSLAPGSEFILQVKLRGTAGRDP